MSVRMVVAAFLVVATGAGAAMLWRDGAGTAEVASFRAVPVDRGAITAPFVAAGTANLLEVGSQAAGQIRALLADFNSRVTAGEAIARLDTDFIEARLRAAEAEIAAAEVNTARAVPLRIGIGDGTVTDVIAGDLAEGDWAIIGLARGGAPSRAPQGGLIPRFGF